MIEPTSIVVPGAGRGVVRGVILDLGGVLLRPASEASFAGVAAVAGIPLVQLHGAYWRYRDAYDCGLLSSAQYWQMTGRSVDRRYTVKEIDALVRADDEMWAAPNPPMVQALEALILAGLAVAILSNVPRDQWGLIVARHPWTAGVATTLSHVVRMTKPDPAIFRHCLAQLGTPAGETVLIDATPRNVESAHALGLDAWLWTRSGEPTIVAALGDIARSAQPADERLPAAAREG